MSYDQTLPLLLNRSLVRLRELGPPPTSLTLNHDMNVRYEFHSEEPGHSTESCKSFKYKVQEPIDSKAIVFTPNVLDILNNLMPPHEGTSVMPQPFSLDKEQEVE